MGWEDAVVGYLAFWGAFVHVVWALLAGWLLWRVVVDRLQSRVEDAFDRVSRGDEHETMADEGRG